MAKTRIIFDSVTNLTATAVGEPGKRTFYLVAGQGGRWVRVWMEKTELQALGVSIEQLLVSQDYAEPQGEPAGLLGQEPPGTPTAEFQVGRLGLMHDPGRDRIVLQMERPADPSGDDITVQCWASKDQMRALSRRIEAVCAAGRPVCPLCGSPIDPDGHACVRTNGHHIGRA